MEFLRLGKRLIRLRVFALDAVDASERQQRGGDLDGITIRTGNFQCIADIMEAL